METTPESEPKKPAAGEIRTCANCGSHEVRRTNRTLQDRIFCRQPYHCGRCKHRYKVFQISWGVVASVAVTLALLAGMFFVVRKLPVFSNPASLSTADADELAKARSAMGGQLSAFEKVLSKRPKTSLDNAAILRLWQAKVSTQVILQMMRTSNGDYDVSPNAVISLREAQVDEAIILAMIGQNNTNH